MTTRKPKRKQTVNVFAEARKYAEGNLQKCAEDLLAWHETGVCPNGAFRACAALLPNDMDPMQSAEDIVKKAALCAAASGGRL